MSANLKPIYLGKLLRRWQRRIEDAQAVRWLFQAVGGYSHSQMAAFGEDILLTSLQRGEIEHKCQQLQQGQPLAYLLGEAFFLGRLFTVNSSVLIPRPETEQLVVCAQKYIHPHKRILDLGTGSGVIAISLKCFCPEAHVWASDRSWSALKVAQRNAVLHQVEIGWICMHWLTALGQQKFDLIVSNPPYIAANDQHLAALSYEPSTALVSGQTGLMDLAEIIQKAPLHLSSQGILMLEHGYNQGAAVRDLLAQNGYCSIKTLLDFQGHERVSVAQYV